MRFVGTSSTGARAPAGQRCKFDVIRRSTVGDPKVTTYPLEQQIAILNHSVTYSDDVHSIGCGWRGQTRPSRTELGESR